jgi:hypothetical protein
MEATASMRAATAAVAAATMLRERRRWRKNEKQACSRKDKNSLEGGVAHLSLLIARWRETPGRPTSCDHSTQLDAQCNRGVARFSDCKFLAQHQPADFTT